MRLRGSLATTHLRDVKGALAVLVLEGRAKKPRKLEIVLELPSVSSKTYAEARTFMERVAGDVSFKLESRDDAVSARTVDRNAATWKARRNPDLFSDLNQWLLKFLLLDRSDGRATSLRSLARVANVSLPTAQRFVEAFTSIGHLVVTDVGYRVVRRRTLMTRWFGWWEGKQSFRTPVRSLFGAERLFRELGEHASHGSISAALGGFAACEARKVLHVRGVGVPELHLDERGIAHLWTQARRCGETEADVVLMSSSTAFETAIFRPIDRGLERAKHGSLPVVDPIQAALDVWSTPLIGKEQANFIIDDVLGFRDGDEA